MSNMKEDLAKPLTDTMMLLQDYMSKSQPLPKFKSEFAQEISEQDTELIFCNYHCQNMPWLFRWLNGFKKDTLISKTAYEHLPKLFQRYLEPHNPRIKYIPRSR